MWNVVGIICVCSVIALCEVPYFQRKGKRWGLCIYLILMTCALGIAVARVLVDNFPNPYDWFAAMYRPFSAKLFGLFE